MASSWLSKAASYAQAAQEAAKEAAEKAAKEAAKFQKEATAAASGLAQGAERLLQLPGETKPNHRELLFEDGPLGFEIEGARVVAIEPEGQADCLGLRVGDELLAVGGDAIPAPPAEGSPEDADGRVKRLIRKWIKNKPRPVSLRFSPIQEEAKGAESLPRQPEEATVSPDTCAVKIQEPKDPGEPPGNTQDVDELLDLDDGFAGMEAEPVVDARQPGVASLMDPLDDHDHPGSAEGDGWDDLDLDARQAVPANNLADPLAEVIAAEAVEAVAEDITLDDPFAEAAPGEAAPALAEDITLDDPFAEMTAPAEVPESATQDDVAEEPVKSPEAVEAVAEDITLDDPFAEATAPGEDALLLGLDYEEMNAATVREAVLVLAEDIALDDPFAEMTAPAEVPESATQDDVAEQPVKSPEAFEAVAEDITLDDPFAEATAPGEEPKLPEPASQELQRALAEHKEELQLVKRSAQQQVQEITLKAKERFQQATEEHERERQARWVK